MSISIDPDIDGGTGFSNGMHVLNFLNSDQATVNGIKLVTPFNGDEYKARRIDDLIQQGMNQADATKLVEDDIKNQDKIAEDGFWIHDLACKADFESAIDPANFARTQVSQTSDRIKDTAVIGKVYTALRGKFWEAYRNSVNAKYRRNITVDGELKNLGNKVFGRIDWMFVGDDGTLHLYLIKATSKSASTWKGVKEETYKYELATLKALLDNNGININNIDLNIVPVHLKYNDDYSKVEDVEVQTTKPYSTRNSGAGYAMDKYDKHIRNFFERKAPTFNVSSQVVIDATKIVNDAIFPELNIKDEGISQSAKEWIRFAPTIDPTGTEPLVIKKVDDRDCMYEVYLNQVLHKCKNKREVEDLVSQHISELEDTKGYATQKLKDAIRSSYMKGYMTFSQIKGLRNASTQLESVFAKYIMSYEKDEQTKKITSREWEMVDDLIDTNILIFRNKDGVYDFIDLTAFDINANAHFSLGDNLLGCYRVNGQYSDMKANYGNIEAVRTMTIINELIPSLPQGSKLGTVGVLSAINGCGYRQFHAGKFNSTYYQQLLKVVKEENKDVTFTNNFTKVEFTDPVDDIIEEYNRITQTMKSADLNTLPKEELDQLKDAYVNNDRVAQASALYSLLERLQNEYGTNFSDPEKLREARQNKYNNNLRIAANLYEMIANAYLFLRDETPVASTKYKPVYNQMFTAATVDSPNIRIVHENVQLTHDTIAQEFVKEYDGNIKSSLDEFEAAKGYSAAQNMIIGNQASVYKHLFDDLQTLTFKNPYDMSNDLDSAERKLLKNMLFQIARINSNGNFKFKSPDDAGIAEWVKHNQYYLWCPLERASKATRRSSAKAITNGMRRFWHKLTHASESFDEFVQGLTYEERELLDSDLSENFYRCHLTNPFSLSIPSSRSGITETLKSRQAMIARNGAEFFETNLRNIMIDFLCKHISTTQFNKLIVGTKALLLEMDITSNFGGNADVMKKEMEFIQNYLKVNVFQKTLMSDFEKKVVGCLTPVKRITSHILLGGNVVSALRDTSEGLKQNFLRSVIKLHTDLNPKNVAKAYTYVFTHSTSNAMAQNLLSKLCLNYRISNTDVARIAERAKTGRNGALNFENWMYSTLRGPDFLNRMTLFVAKCMQDGVWEAFSLDSEGNLKYDWTKDKRFAAYKTAPVGSKEYLKAKSLYLSQIRMYNQEHVDDPVTIEQGLPAPYTNVEITNIKNLGDNIYGSYDKSKQPMALAHSLGWLYGSFSNWMNGIMNNYFLPAQKNKTFKVKKEQEVDSKGNKLFLDDNGNITTEDTGMPCYKTVPVIIQGIFPMLHDLYLMTKKNGLAATKAYVKSNEQARANFHKLWTDALMALFWLAIIKLLFGTNYEEFKKTMKDNPVYENALTELLYKAESSSYSQSLGPLNIMQFMGGNMVPPFYSTPVKLATDLMKVTFGNKSANCLLFDYTGITRSFKDTGRAFLKGME